jgi:hypothetical protein
MAMTTEVKFMVSRATTKEIGEWVSGKLDPDAHVPEAGSYRITSFYFDTNEFDTFFGRASYARAKYRIRRYNDSPIVFLERKLKKAGRVVKRRSEFALGDLPQTYANEISEGRWFWRRLERRRLQPVCQITYRRKARVGTFRAGPLRLTIDEEVRAIADAVRFTEHSGVELLRGRAILELKYNGDVPPMFAQLIEYFHLQPQSISKYRIAVKALRLVGHDEEQVVRAR